MQLTPDNKINEKPLHSFYEEGTFELLKRFKEENYPTQFNLLKNWALLKSFKIMNDKLISDYIHLLDQEQFDENEI